MTSRAALLARVRARLAGEAGASSAKKLLFVVLAVASVERLVFVLHTHPPREYLWSDMAGYVDRALRLADSGVRLGPGDTLYPPGTHVLLAPALWIAGPTGGMIVDQCLWWALAVGTLAGVAALGIKLYGHAAPAIVAVAALLGHAAFGSHAGFFTSENPFTCFMVLALVAGVRAADLPEVEGTRRTRAFALAGVLAGMATTIRPQFLLGAALLALPIWRRGRARAAGAEAGALAAGFLVPCLLAMALNTWAARAPTGLSSNAGLNFYQGHCQVDLVVTVVGDATLEFSAPPRAQHARRAGRVTQTRVFATPPWDGSFFFREGLECVRAEGLGHLRRVASNVADLFATTDPWPTEPGRVDRARPFANRVFSWAYLVLVPVAVALARSRRPERWLLLQLVTLLPLAIVFYGDPRYRIPYDVFVALLLGGAVAAPLGLRADVRPS